MKGDTSAAQMVRILATAILCPHGKATSWNGVARFGDPLPEVEHCEECNPGAVSLTP